MTHLLAWPCNELFSVPNSSILVLFGLTSGAHSCIRYTDLHLVTLLFSRPFSYSF